MLRCPAAVGCAITAVFSLQIVASDVSLSAQQASDKPEIQFSVVSVKPSAVDQHKGVYRFTADSIVEANNPARWLVQAAFGITDARAVVGLPGWALDERFDVEAKVDSKDAAAFAALPPQDKSKLLQAVLSERFGLKAHTEMRQLSGWALVPFKGAAKINPASLTDGDNGTKVWKITGRYHLDAKNITMAEFCNLLLSTEAQNMAVDETQMPGAYDFSLSWSREGQPDAADSPDIFTALKEQLGLQLVPKKIPETVLVVDEIHRPTPN